MKRSEWSRFWKEPIPTKAKPVYSIVNDDDDDDDEKLVTKKPGKLSSVD